MFGKLRKFISLRNKPKTGLAKTAKSELLSWHIGENQKNQRWVADPDLALTASRKKRHHLDLMLTDPAIKQAVDTRHDALLGTPWYISPSEGEMPTFIWDNLNIIINKVLSACFNALLYGFSVSERIYTVDEKTSRIVLHDIRPCPIKDFVFDNKDSLKRFVNGTLEDVDLRYKYLLTRNKPTVENPYGDSLLATLYWTYFYRVNTNKFMMMYLERMGIPLLVGKGAADLEEFRQQLKESYQDSVIAVDSEANVEFATAGSNKQQFTDILAELNREIVTLILGATLTSGTDGGSGNRALGQVHNDIRMDKRDSDIKMVSCSVQNVIDALVSLNFTTSEPPPAISFGSRKNLNQDQANRDALLLNSGALTFTKSYFEDEYNLDPEHFEIPTIAAPIESKAGNQNQGSKLKYKKSPIVLTANLAGSENDGGNNDDSRLDRLLASLVADNQAKPGGISEEELKAVIAASADQDDLNSRLWGLLLASTEQAARKPAQAVEPLAEALLEAEIIGDIGAEE